MPQASIMCVLITHFTDIGMNCHILCVLSGYGGDFASETACSM